MTTTILTTAVLIALILVLIRELFALFTSRRSRLQRRNNRECIVQEQRHDVLYVPIGQDCVYQRCDTGISYELLLNSLIAQCIELLNEEALRSWQSALDKL
jgi:hypothetical protein